MARVMAVCIKLGASSYTGIDLEQTQPFAGLSRKMYDCSLCDQKHRIRLPHFEGDPAFKDGSISMEIAPEVAAEIGVLMGYLSMIEFSLVRMMVVLTELSENDAKLILGRSSIGERVELLYALALSREEKDPKRMYVCEFIPRIREVVAARNKYAHSNFTIMQNAEGYIITVRPWFHDSKKKNKQVFTESLDDIEAEVRRARTLFNDLRHRPGP